MKPTGYLVMESCEDYEQALRLLTGSVLPPGGILEWADDRQARTIFATRADARAAIDRTEHYRLAYGATNLPEKRFCKIVPALLLPEGGHG